ncbi:MAG: O-antigen ligase family protein [Pyrinomonadaceae bacterium]
MTATQHPAPTLTAARWLMLLYVMVLPIVRPLDTRLLGIHVFTTDLIFAAAFLFWMLSLVKRRPMMNLRFLGSALAFLLALTVSAAFSTEPQKSVVKLVGVFYLIAVSVVIADLVQDVGFLKRLTYAWAVGAVITILGTAAGAVGFYLGYDSMATNFFLFHAGSLPVGHYPRVMAFFENPNMTANYLNVAVMLVLGGGRVGWLSKRISAILAALLFGSAMFTISPGIGGMVLSVGLWVSLVVFANDKRKKWLVFGGCVAVALIALISTTISPITRENENTFTVSIIEKRIEPSVRVLVWKNSIDRALEYPILGRGTGTDAAKLRYQVVSGQNQMLLDAHQAWLNIFGQAGVVGLIAFIALCINLLSICRFRTDGATERSTLLAACSCAFVGAFLFQNLFGSFEDARQLWVLIGMLVGLAGTSSGVES